jgi:peptide methionine sulfoxide reductase MsrA
MSENTETAILAGGCFWPAQELLRHRDGVISTRVSGLWPGKVVTKVSEAGPFWEAEAEDQEYLRHYPEGKNQFSL